MRHGWGGGEITLRVVERDDPAAAPVDAGA